MTIRRRWLIELPHVENLHTSIHAFLRTSDFGTWEPDPTTPSDSFVLCYRRGHELPAPISKVRYFLTSGGDYEDTVAASGWPYSHRPPIRLHVKLRPSRNGIRVGTEWEVSSQYEDLFMSLEGKLFEAEVEDELRALVKYLADYCGLPELPTLTCESD